MELNQSVVPAARGEIVPGIGGTKIYACERRFANPLDSLFTKDIVNGR